MKQEIFIDELPPGLNGSNGIRNAHYHQLNKQKKEWVWLMRAQNPQKHKGKVKVRYTRVSTQPMDLDNVGASFKFIGDALVQNEVIEDDSPDVLTELHVGWEKAPSQNEQGVKIEIQSIEMLSENGE